MKNKEMNKQEMIRLLKKNGIVPDVRCTKEDLEALIDLEINNK
jgi:hypothetical protein